MGLDTTHDCWHGAYRAFMKWRCKIAEVAGFPPLKWMEGFYGYRDISSDAVERAVSALGFQENVMWASELLSALRFGGCLPIKWDSLRPSPLHILLSHSDCDGEIESKHCSGIADELEKLIPKLPDCEAGGHIGHWREKTQMFVDGLRLAASKGENVVFQ
jgi:hypothetical protein